MKRSAPTAALAAVGSEVLAGDVLDSNSHHLARTLTGLGARMTQIRILPDDPTVLEAGLTEMLVTGPRLLISTGGLGPTVDDATAAAWARVLELPLVEDPVVLDRVAAMYASFAERGWVTDGALTPSRRKMAMIPEGARTLINTVGAAPGLVMERPRTTIVALPGVPEEMKAMVEGPLRPVLRALLGASCYREDIVLVASGDESAVAPALEQAAAECPSVRIKSRARRFGAGVRVRVTLSARGDDDGALRRLIEDAADAVARQCQSIGLAVETTGG